MRQKVSRLHNVRGEVSDVFPSRKVWIARFVPWEDPSESFVLQSLLIVSIWILFRKICRQAATKVCAIESIAFLSMQHIFFRFVSLLSTAFRLELSLWLPFGFTAKYSVDSCRGSMKMFTNRRLSCSFDYSTGILHCQKPKRKPIN